MPGTKSLMRHGHLITVVPSDTGRASLELSTQPRVTVCNDDKDRDTYRLCARLPGVACYEDDSLLTPDDQLFVWDAEG